MKREEGEGMFTDFLLWWAPDEGSSASMNESSQGEDVDERGRRSKGVKAIELKDNVEANASSRR